MWETGTTTTEIIKNNNVLLIMQPSWYKFIVVDIAEKKWIKNIIIHINILLYFSLVLFVLNAISFN